MKPEQMEKSVRVMQASHVEIARAMHGVMLVMSALIKTHPNPELMRQVLTAMTKDRLLDIPDGAMNRGIPVENTRENLEDLQTRMAGWLALLPKT